MFARTRYLTWALQHYGKVAFDLASSGTPAFSWAGIPAPDIEDGAAYPALRAAIAHYNDVPMTEVTPALGTSHAVFLSYAAILSAGDEILVETPGYEPLSLAGQGLGVTVRTFERRVEDGFRILPERVEAALGPRTRAIVLTTLHNPSGVRTSDETLRELAAMMAARGGYVIVDEVYAAFDDLIVNGVFRGSSRKLASNIIAVSSLTKCYGLGTHRIGWVLGPESVAESAEAASMATIGYNVPLSHAAYGVAAFGALDRMATRAKELCAGKRAIAERWAATLTNAHWSAPREGLFGLLTLPGRGDLLRRIEIHAQEAGVLVAAGTFFGAPESFRVSWATCDATRFSEALDRLTPLAR